MDDTAIKVEQVSKTFKLPHESAGSIKNTIVNFASRKKGYEIQQVLDGISFNVKQGEFFGIVGRNGSGKSTLLKMLAGIYTPTEGIITVNGKLTPFIELGVGFSPDLTGRENVFLNGALLGFNRKEMTVMYDSIVAFAELERFMDQKLKNYSSGMQVRLAFSIAIQANTDILLLDEVLAVGDAAFQQKCFDYFEQMKREKKTIVIVTHDMSAVKRFCTRAAYITEGKIKKIGDPIEIADLYTEANIESAQGSDDTSANTDYEISTNVVSHIGNKVVMEFNYVTKSRRKDDMYIGISLIRDGLTVADLTTPLDHPLRSTGYVTYTLDTAILNGGVYQVTASLFRRENREVLAISKHRNVFTIEGEDITRGNALKLDHAWEYEKASNKATQ